jgi:hypothetical protein
MLRYIKTKLQAWGQALKARDQVTRICARRSERLLGRPIVWLSNQLTDFRVVACR